MLLQIHDELVLECPDEETDRLVPLVRTAMEHALDLRAPLVVDVMQGPNWLDLEAITA